MNLMSAIGIVVTCGIIINDSILKLDAINELRKEGVPLMEAIHEAGRRAPAPYHHDIINDNIRNGSAAFHIRYGQRTAKAALHCHDLGDADRYGSQPFCHTTDILVHLSQT